MNEPRVSASPRSTWLWAADDPDAARVRKVLDADAHFWVPPAVATLTGLGRLADLAPG